MLSEALDYGLRLWREFSVLLDDQPTAQRFEAEANSLNAAINQHYWDGRWYARGYTDAGRNFGVHTDRAGKIYINSQTFALLSGAATGRRAAACIRSVEKRLGTSYGPLKVAPAFTAMCENVGRMTQKHPGSDVNGSVYTHAAAFYIFALYAVGRGDLAFRHFRNMLPGPEKSALRRSQQFPVYLPNYYRGNQFPRHAGLSSHMVHTSSANWNYRSIVEHLFGLQGTPQGLRVCPQLPSAWKQARVIRFFRGATLEVIYRRSPRIKQPLVRLDGQTTPDGLLTGLRAGEKYRVEVLLPKCAKGSSGIIP
jgi:cellobionic acid phosphorylase